MWPKALYLLACSFRRSNIGNVGGHDPASIDWEALFLNPRIKKVAVTTRVELQRSLQESLPSLHSSNCVVSASLSARLQFPAWQGRIAPLQNAHRIRSNLREALNDSINHRNLPVRNEPTLGHFHSRPASSAPTCGFLFLHSPIDLTGSLRLPRGLCAFQLSI